MLHDLAFGRLENEFRILSPQKGDIVVCIQDSSILVCRDKLDALQLPTSVLAGDLTPSDWALAVMAENGVELPGEGPLTRAHVAMALYRISKLIPTAPGMQVMR